MKDKSVAIIGAGELGRRIALSWASGGFNVNLYDPSPFNRNASLAFVHHNLDLVTLLPKRNPGGVRIFEDVENAIHQAWLVVESSSNDFTNNLEILPVIERSLAKDAIIAVASSAYTPRDWASSLPEQRRQRALSLRYPLVPGSRLVEVMTNGFASPETMSIVSSQLEECGLCPVAVHKESAGFVMARIWAAVQREAIAVLAEGITTPDQIDKAWNLLMEGSHIGPCMSMDAMGLENVARFEEHLGSTQKSSDGTTLSYLQKNYLSTGRLGAKSRQGGLYPHTSANLSKLSHPSHNALTPLLFVLNLGTAVEHPSLHTGEVYLASPDGRELKTLVSDQPRPDGIDISLTNGMMYWTCMGTPGKNDGFIKSCSIAGGKPTDLIPAGVVNTPKQIVVDHVNSKLYFCDREGMKVWRCNLDGTQLEILIQTGDLDNESHGVDQTRWCVGICVSPSTGHFYWTQKGPSKGNKGRIFRAGMNMPAGETATTRTDIECLFENLPEPIDLELDEDNQVLWWTDRGDYPTGNSLNKADLKDSNLTRELVARHFHEAIGLKIDWVNLHVYLTDIGGEIYVMDIDGKNKKRIYEDEDAAFSGICLIHV